jgi:hypothetical protein
LSCESDANKVARAACGLSRLASKKSFYLGASLGLAGIGATLLTRQMMKRARRARTERRAQVTAYNAQVDEINRLIEEAGDPPEGEHTRYHMFDRGGSYSGWTHSRAAAERIAEFNHFTLVEAPSTEDEREVARRFRADQPGEALSS